MPSQPANTIGTEEFVGSVIPKLIDGKNGLRAFFSTYNEVTGHNSGPVETGDPNLEIAVSAGGAQPASLCEIFDSTERALRAAAVGDFAAANRELDSATRDARQGQVAVAAAMADQTARQSYPDVAVVYAGYSAFRQAIATVTDLHKQSPETFIAVLTCDCDLGAKRWELGTIDGLGAVVVTPRCGGRRDMRDLLEAFVAMWPNRVQR